MRNLTTLFALLFIIMLFAEPCALFWTRRRRRRSPPPPPVIPVCIPRHCVLSSWTSWSSCSQPCGDSGTTSRTRYKRSVENSCGNCGHLSETEKCNRDVCKGYKGSIGSHKTGCNCRAGYTGTCCRSGKL